MDDAADLLAWRNDELTKHNSRNSEEIERAEHLAWLQTILSRSDVQLFIAEETGQPVGTVRMDQFTAVPEMSVTVSPEHRGKGLYSRMVEAALPDGPCIAHVLQHNLTVQRANARMGWHLVEDGPIQLWRHSGRTSQGALIEINAPSAKSSVPDTRSV